MGSDQRQVEVSYDVSNEFFRLWLDEAMFYTSAVFATPDQTLEEAQRNKMRILCDFAGIDANSKVLDIGCGWGAAMEYIEREHHPKATHGITLSRAQMDEINRRNVPGLEAKVADFRTFETDEKYSALISICMIDHLCSPEEARHGKALDIYRAYFKKAWELTTPGAKFGFQAILRNRVPRDKHDLAELHWVTHEIFPGGLNPRLEELIAAVNPYWEVREVHTRREDYRKTTHEWRRRLRANEAKIRKEFGDQVFVDYDRYLSCCVVSFEKHYSSLTQMRLHRIDALEEPRKDMSNQDELFGLFKQIAEEVSKKPLPNVTRQSVIAEMGIDSLSMMQIVGEMESRLDVLVPDDQLVKLVTVEDLIAVVAKQKAQAS